MSSKLKAQIANSNNYNNVSQSSSIDLEIVKLETKLTKNANNLEILLQLTELYMQLGRKSKIQLYVNLSIKEYLSNYNIYNNEKGMLLSSIAMRFWRAERYSNKDNLRFLLFFLFMSY